MSLCIGSTKSSKLYLGDTAVKKAYLGDNVVYSSAKQYTVTVLVDPTAGGTVTGAGSYDEGTSVTVKASVKSGYTFSEWKENGTTVSTSSSYTFTITEDVELTASFAKQAVVNNFNSVSIPTAIPYNPSITYGGSKFVIVSNTTIVYSANGLSWTNSYLPQNAEIIAYGNGKFVTFGGYNSSTCLYSTNVTSWLQSNTLPIKVSGWSSVVYGSGKFIAVPSGGTDKIIYSLDGIDWVTASLPSSGYWSHIAYGGNKFVLVEDQNTVGTTNNRILYSSNGTTWNAVTLPSSQMWRDISYGNGRFVIISGNSAKSLYSTNGTNWYEGGTLPFSDGISIAYGTNNFLVISMSSNKAAYSTNGATWETKTMPTPDGYYWYDVAFGAGKFVAAEAGGSKITYAIES